MYQMLFDRVKENDVIQIRDEELSSKCRFFIGELRILRAFDGTSTWQFNTVGTAATNGQRTFEFKSDYDSQQFKFQANKEYYFNPQESVALSGGYGNPGTGSTIVFEVPGAGGTSILYQTSGNIPERS